MGWGRLNREGGVAMAGPWEPRERVGQRIYMAIITQLFQSCTVGSLECGSHMQVGSYYSSYYYAHPGAQWSSQFLGDEMVHDYFKVRGCVMQVPIV